MRQTLVSLLYIRDGGRVDYVMDCFFFGGYLFQFKSQYVVNCSSILNKNDNNTNLYEYILHERRWLCGLGDGLLIIGGILC